MYIKQTCIKSFSLLFAQLSKVYGIWYVKLEACSLFLLNFDDSLLRLGNGGGGIGGDEISVLGVECFNEVSDYGPDFGDAIVKHGEDDDKEEGNL